MKKFALIPVILVFVMIFHGCMGAGKSMDGAGSAHNGYGESEQSPVQPGTLTAGEWNDNKNYDFFLNLFDLGDSEVGIEGSEPPEQSGKGVFADYRETWNMNLFHRISVDVTCKNTNCSGAKVSLYEGESLLVSAVANARGRAYLYPKKISPSAQYRLVTSYNGIRDERAILPDGNPVAVELSGSAEAVRTIDLCFAIDTTGSMSDELSYLKAEIDSVIGRVKESNSDVEIRLALVFYRDEGDVYLTKKYDFTTNIEKQRKVLNEQNADGGGDYPEAVHTALSDSLGLSWRENSSKMLFFVLDAPPHDTQEISADYGNLVYQASNMGVRIVPLAASGADILTQYVMRSAAAITNGTYIFLTDHSGVGLPHEAPVVGDFTVEYLNDCLVRVINELYTGVEVPPVSVFEQSL